MNDNIMINAIRKMLEENDIEYTKIYCEIYKWATLSSKVSDNILHITRE